MSVTNDFSRGGVGKNILNLALPMTLAQLINVLYNVIDRMYIGRIPGSATLALPGVGLTLPIITMLGAFANLFGTGGAPLFSIARGEQKPNRAQKIMGNSMAMLLLSGLILSLFFFILKKPMLYLLGASDATYPYASSYLSIYLIGTLFVMITMGMNGYINAQGFGRVGMLTILIGAILNLILDPLFIFVFDLGVPGAAIATVIAQAVSALWVVFFLTGRKALIRLTLPDMHLDFSLVRQISALGLSGFIMSVTNSAVTMVCNATLQSFGGDLYVSIMTVANSIREIISMPVMGLTSGAQPVISYNYGAKRYDRVLSGIRFMFVGGTLYTVAAWALTYAFPGFFIRIFSDDTELLTTGVAALRIYFFGFFMMALQFAGQSAFVALGKSHQAVFFSLLRKAVIVIPLTLILPHLFGLNTTGVFLAEPISNFIGGLACFLTMLATVYIPLKREGSTKK